MVCSCGVEGVGLRRRGVLGLAGLAAAGTMLPRVALAQKPAYRAMLLSCVDPRTQAPIATWMDAPAPGSHAIALLGRYSQFTIAGAMVGVTAPAFARWDATFWDNLSASIKLHGVTTLIAVDHGNCGAVGIAYGQHVLDDPAKEMAVHHDAATHLRAQLKHRHPSMAFQAWFVGRDDLQQFTRWSPLADGPEIA